MSRLSFKVLVPAMMPDVTGGTKVGNKWMGCTYIKAPYSIPGFGEIEEL